MRPSKGEVLEWERRFRDPAAVAAFTAVVFYIVSVLIEQGSGLRTSGLKSVQLVSLHEHSGALLFASIIRAVGLALISLPFFYLFEAAKARNPKVRPAMVSFAFLGPVLMAAQSVLAWIASQQISSDFVSRLSGSPHPEQLAETLINNSSTSKVASGLLIPAVLGMMVALIYICFHAMRVGLLTRFTGSLGIALGAAMILIFPVALLAIMLWLVFVGLLFIGRSPGGRPPAWDSGEAVPWPTPGEKAAASLAASEGEPTKPSALPDGDRTKTAGLERRKRKQRD
jgi:hypothetical protein